MFSGKGEGKERVGYQGAIVRGIQVGEKWAVVQGLDMGCKFVSTKTILGLENGESVAFPQKYKIVKMSATGMMYCCEGMRITRYNTNQELFVNGETVALKGEV